MNTTHPIAAVALLALCLGTSACSGNATDAANTVSESISEATAESGTITKAMEEARIKLREENFPLTRKDGGPEAEITPEGEFLIDGKAVEMTAEQRKALGLYREELIEIADAGIALGQEGVAIAGKAVSQALSGLFTGQSDDVKASIEAEAKKIEATAMRLCRRAEGLQATQDALVEILPEFKPYAGNINTDIDCNSENSGPEGDSKDAEVETTQTLST